MDIHTTIREKFKNISGVEVLSSQKNICVLYGVSISVSLRVQEIFTQVGIYPYRIIPSNFRTGWHIIVLL